jgi:dipeptide/tripeptide permease
MQEIRTGFEPAFWVANGTELFERLAYYGVQAVLAVYLHENLHFSDATTGDLIGKFGLIVWFLPIIGGSLADRFGFRRSLAFAYMALAAGYFLLGSLSATWMAPLRNAVPLEWLVLGVLAVPALGPGIVKPCIVGTTARASSENVRSLGYSLYYTIVNIGGTLGPLVAFAVRRTIGIENVFRVCALSVLLMFFAVIFFFREPSRSGEAQVASVLHALKNMLVVIGNYKMFLVAAGIALAVRIGGAVFGFSAPWWFWLIVLGIALASLSRFMWFLVIFSGFYAIFWEQYIALPLFIRGYVNAKADIELLLAVDALSVICLQIIVSLLTRKIPTFRAIALGTLVSSCSWILLATSGLSWQVAGLPVFALVAMFVIALGEMILSPRYYEYVSRLAPPGQQGTYMGYAFLPVGIGFFIAGAMGGRLVHYYGEVLHRPQQLWWVVVAVGVLTTILMLIYDRFWARGAVATAS